MRQSENPIKNNSETMINSYDTHRFLLKFVNGQPDLSEAEFTKGPYEETVTIMHDQSNGLYAVQESTFDKFVSNMKTASTSCSSSDNYSDCITSQLFTGYYRTHQRMQTLTTYRDAISSKLRNYTCLDDSLNTSTPIATKNQTILGRRVTVDSLFEKDRAKIWVVHDFVSDSECDVLTDFAERKLSVSRLSIDQFQYAVHGNADGATDPLL